MSSPFTRLPFKAPISCGLEVGSTFTVDGLYTGPIDIDFLPHGQGTFTAKSGTVDTTEWVHGCPQRRVSTISIQTGWQDAAESDCDAVMEICDSLGNCCKTSTDGQGIS